jgi:hypothetical protein
VYFNPSQMSIANSAFSHGERLVGKHFRLSQDGMKNYRYDVKTLAYLENHEVDDKAFAHICKYQRSEEDDNCRANGLYFYRICLQDNRILSAVERSNPFIKLDPLMLYIATHELVHVIRFDSGQVDFDAPLQDKKLEEEKVHAITKDMLQQIMNPGMRLVLDCFSSRYKIGNMFN